MAAVKDNLRHVPVSVIRPNPAALRAVNKDTLNWKEFVDSIRSMGILNPLVGREVKDKDTGATYIGLVDGLHRFTGACEAGLDTVPMNIIEADEVDTLMAQIIGNIQKVETKPAQYADQLKRILVINDTLTMDELATKLGKSTAWLSERLRLTDLSDAIKELVDTGKISITNAQALSKLPPDEQPDYVDRAMTMSPAQFAPLANQRAKEIKDAQKQGRAPAPRSFQPNPRFQSFAMVRDELDSLSIGRSLIHQTGVSDPLDVWKLAVSWVLHLDENSIAADKAEWDAAEQRKEEEKAKRKAEREQKKAQEAAAAAAAVAVG